jgi:hypothetical protein
MGRGSALIDQESHDRAAAAWAMINEELHARAAAMWKSLNDSERVEVKVASARGENLPTHLVAKFVHGGVRPLAGYWPSVEAGLRGFPMPEPMIDYLLEIGELDTDDE